MPFNSLTYFLFLPVVYLLFSVAGDRARCWVLFAASMLFYAALDVPYLPVVLALVAITTYGSGIWLDRAKTPEAKRRWLLIGVAVNVLILVAMKYLPFISENLKALSTLLSLDIPIRPVKTFVAVGVSFYVFQAISYLLDVYLEIEKPERHFGYFALYLSFFPKLLQGPIERASDLLPQLKNEYRFNYDNMRFGMLLFTWGLFKKVVIADRLSLYVDHVYSNVHAFKGLSLLLATYAYAFQIYMDFSGYTDMALGSALLFNINLTRNFDSPYLATSVADFWRRWHITFSRWILDYIFKPLQMQWRNRKKLGTAAALLVTFLISGIWHGASWGFVVWGALHGLFMACSVLYRPYQKKLHKALGIEQGKSLKLWQIFVTFNLVSFAWVFFRANNLKDAVYVLSNMFLNGLRGVRWGFLLSYGTSEISILIIALLLYAYLTAQTKIKCLFDKPSWFRWCIYVVCVMAILLFSNLSNGSFLYARF